MNGIDGPTVGDLAYWKAQETSRLVGYLMAVEYREILRCDMAPYAHDFSAVPPDLMGRWLKNESRIKDGEWIVRRYFGEVEPWRLEP